MPKKRTSTTVPEVVRTTRAFEHALQAVGAPARKPGFARTPDEDLQFALGFPYCRYVSDADVADPAAACEVVKNAIITVAPLIGRMTWPRDLAHRLVRALASEAVSGFNWTDAASAVIANDAPIEEDEAAVLVAAMIHRASVLPVGIIDFVFLLEALHGPERIAEAITTALEARATPPSVAAFVVHLLGFLLLRVRTEVGLGLRARLEAVFARWCPSLDPGPRGREEVASAMRALDLVLHGGTAARRSLLAIGNGRTFDLQGLQHVTDDRALVHAMVAQEQKPAKAAIGWLPDARLVFLGGDAVLEHYAAWVSLVRPTSLDFLIDSFEPICAAKNTDLFTALAKLPRAKKRATEWLAAHAPAR